MGEMWAIYSLDIMSHACVLAIGCCIGYAFRKPRVVEKIVRPPLPKRGARGRFIPKEPA